MRKKQFQLQLINSSLSKQPVLENSVLSVPCGELILLYLRFTGFYVAVALVGNDDDAVWGDLAARHFEGRWDGAALEEAFALAERDRDYHELHFIDKIIFEKRLEQIGAAITSNLESKSQPK